MSRIAIIGAGISGLTAAYDLKRAGHQVTVFESSHRTGGAVETLRWGDEILEVGPDSLLRSKPAAMDLAKELNIKLVDSCAEGSPSVVKGGRLHPLPDGFRLLAPTRFVPFALTKLLSVRGKLRAAAEVFMPVRAELTDESVADFVARRFGQELLDNLAQPLIGGIYSADPSKLSLQATFPFFQVLERSGGSVIKGMLKSLKGPRTQAQESFFLAPEKGMSNLTDRLAEEIGSDNIRLSCAVSEIVRENERWVLSLESGNEAFEGLVLACPAHRAALLLQGVDASISEGLRQVPYTSTATLNLLFEEGQIAQQLSGSGFVVPQIENLDITACTYAHKKYPGRASEGKALFRIHMGGKLNQEILKQKDDELIEAAIATLRPLLKLSGAPSKSHLVRHRKVVPQYAVGHVALREDLDKLLSHHPTLTLAGNGLHGVGLSDCVTQARSCAKHLQAQFS